jgi:response regulator RpfG family c-di-GMP phosphodiesterase
MSLTQIRPTEYLLEKRTILVVDDERGPRETLRMILSPAHKVITAESGAKALETLRNTPVDLVTVDLNMPGMKGDELMRCIRSEFPFTEVVIITGYGSVETAAEGVRYGICDYLSKPFDVVQVSSAVSRALARRQSRRRLVDFLEGLGSVLGRDRDSSDLLVELEANSEIREKLRAMLDEPALEPGSHAPRGDRTLEFLDVLTQTIENGGAGHSGHARRVAFYADTIGAQLGLEGEERSHLQIASFLHDFGKVGVDDAGGPRRAADEEHAEIGERLVGPLGFPKPVALAIRHHHERFDGDGHPDRCSGEGIPLASRIIAVADAFDSLTTDRPDAPPQSTEDAIDQLQKQAGEAFDPAIVDTLASLLANGQMTAPELDAQFSSAAMGAR